MSFKHLVIRELYLLKKWVINLGLYLNGLTLNPETELSDNLRKQDLRLQQH